MSLHSVYQRCIRGVVSISSGHNNKAMSISTGFFIDRLHIVTCCHCVYDNIGRRFSIIKIAIGSYIYDVDLLGVDGTADVAVLRTRYQIDNVHPLQWRDTIPNIGDQCVAIGNPMGDVQSISNAYIRDVSFYGSSLLPTIFESILIDGSSIGGNSGGPLIDMDGYVIGIVSYGYSNTTTGTMNGALPSWIASSIVSNIIRYSSNYTFGTLGIKVSPMYINDCILIDMNKVCGYMVVNSIHNDIRVGDIITHIDNIEIGQFNDQRCIFSMIHMCPGKKVSLLIKRKNGDVNISTIIHSTTSVVAQNGML